MTWDRIPFQGFKVKWYPPVIESTIWCVMKMYENVMAVIV